MEKMRENREVWIVPIAENRERNVWLMIVQSTASGRAPVRVMRVFSTKPTEAIIAYERKNALQHQTRWNEDGEVDIEFFEAAVDFYTDREIECVGC